MQPKVGVKLLKQLHKAHPPSAWVRFRFGRYDVATKTDKEGTAMLLYIGKADEQGRIHGDQFTRRILRDETGSIVKDHWDYKGKR